MADVDWSEPFHAEYRYMRVLRSTGAEAEKLEGFLDGGTIERNADVQIKEKGSVAHDGPLDIGSDLVRVYLDARGMFTGWEASEALGTFLASTTTMDVDGSVSTCGVSLTGRLSELEQDRFERPVTVPAGSNPVEKAVEIVRAAGLDVAADATDFKMRSDWTFGLGEDGGGTKLDAVNDLLREAGFSSAATDAMGRVQMRRYHAPGTREPVHAFVEGAGARFMREITDERDATGIANVVMTVYTDQETTTVGTAIDEDPESPYSTVSMGRRIVARYDYTNAATQERADAKAAELLKTNQSVIRRVTFTHAYVPVAVGDVVRLDYPGGGVRERLAVRTQSIELGAGCLVKCEGRSYGR